MNTLFEARFEMYWSQMNEYYRQFWLFSSANIAKYIMSALTVCLAVVDIIMLKDRPNSTMDIAFMGLIAVVAILASAMNFIRYSRIKKLAARRDSETTHKERISRVTEDGVVTATDTQDESSVSFSEIKFMFIGKTALFVHTKSALLHVFPKDSFTVGDAAGMVEFMEQKGVKIK